MAVQLQLGPILGAVSARDATVWAEWKDASAPPRLILERSETKTCEPIPSHPTAGIFRLTGLKPDAEYSYQVEGDDSRSHTFRTLAPEGTTGTLAVVSCNRSQLYRGDPALGDEVWADLHNQILAGNVSVVLHVGDQIYADEVWDAISTAHLERQSRRPEPARKIEEWCAANRSLWVEAYRNLYRAAWDRERAVARVLAAVPNLMIWDDHDIHDGYGSRASDFWLPYNRIFDVARQVYCEYQHPLNPIGPPVEGALPWATRWPAADMFAMDLRSLRRYDQNPSEVLGKKQMAALRSWAQDRAAHDPGDPQSFAPVTFLVASTPPLLFGKTDHPLYTIVPDMIDDLRDQWIHGANIEELEEFLRLCEWLRSTKKTAVVVLAGDIHIHHLVRCTRTGKNLVFHQVTSSPVGNTPVGGLLGRIVYGRGGLAGKTHPDSAFSGAIDKKSLIGGRGYAVVRWSIDERLSLEVTWRILGADGKITANGPFELT